MPRRVPPAKPGSTGRAEQIRAGASSAEGAASTAPERTNTVREERSASGNARMSRPSSEDARGDRWIQATNRDRPRPEPRCPHCDARDAEVISLFGTQAMTLQYRCRRCATMFEAIKYG